MTTKAPKTVEEHVSTALKFLEDSNREFLSGDSPQGSEKLWGAASQAVIAWIKKHGLPYGGHNHLVAAVVELAKESGDSAFESEFGVAEGFHANFYHDFMPDEVIARLGPIVHRFVYRVLESVGDAA